MSSESEDTDEVLIDFIGDDDDSMEIDSAVESSVMDVIENTLDDLDMNISFGIKLSSRPHFDWAEECEGTYETGQRVCRKGEDVVWKVVGYGKEIHTYELKKTGDNAIFVEDGMNIKLAPEGAFWQSYTDATDPLKVAGLTISCPSNKKFGA
jgi:hypothetical protein